MDKTNMDKIRYRDLSWPLKVSVIVSWIVLSAWFTNFVIGFLLGLAG